MLKCVVKRQAGLRAVRKTPLGKEIETGARGPPAGSSRHWALTGSGQVTPLDSLTAAPTHHHTTTGIWGGGTPA